MYVPVFLPNSSAHTRNQSLIHLVGEVDIGSMVDQLPDNLHISLLGRPHEGSLLSALEIDNRNTNHQLATSDILYKETRNAKVLIAK